jgi:hypothetical protein
VQALQRPGCSRSNAGGIECGTSFHLAFIEEKKKFREKIPDGARGYSFVEKAVNMECNDGEMEGQHVRMAGENEIDRVLVTTIDGEQHDKR